MHHVDVSKLVSTADLVYRSPVAASYEGQPIGNGRMGTLVWTTPRSIEFQINRNDVFAAGSNLSSHQAWPMGPRGETVDYCGACARVTVDMGGDVFTGRERFEQKLSLHDAETTIRSEGISVRCLMSAVGDVLALEVEDSRARPEPIQVKVWMWREPEVRTADHVARYAIRCDGDSAAIVQRFELRDFYCASAVAARIVDQDAAGEMDDRSCTLTAPAKQGRQMVMISSAASWSAADDVADRATGWLDRMADRSYDEIRREHVEWWSAFWSRTFVRISSPDPVAQQMQRVRLLHLYYMASTSRGMYPPKWNGSLFLTDGDTRYWGSQFWVWTGETLYFPLLAADAIDLTESHFDMYIRQLPKCYEAAQQRWGVSGAFYPETTPFFGPVILPEEAGREFQDVYLGRKPPELFSKPTHDLCLFDSSLRTVAEREEKGPVGRFSWISHLVSSGSELAMQFWWRYRYTGDVEWLRTHVYPILKGTVEFYRHMVRKGSDGRYHIEGTNVHEMYWGVKDGIMDLAAIRGTVPLAIRAAEILGVDEDMRTAWRELLDNVAPYPTGNDPQSQALEGSALAPDAWSAGHAGEVAVRKHIEDVWLTPVFPFEDWTLETDDPETERIVRTLIDLVPRMKMIMNGEQTNTADRTPIVVARAGLGEMVPKVCDRYYAAFSPMAHGMSAFEGGTPENQAQSVEHLGVLTMTLQEALLQSVSARPGEPEVIRVFPAWPRIWDAEFRLLARGGFLVTSSIRNGRVELVEIESRVGETCRLRNPWNGPCRVTKNGVQVGETDSLLLEFPTRPQDRLMLTPLGAA